MKQFVRINKRLLALFLLAGLGLQSCVGMLAGAAVDTTVAVVKVPVKVTAAAAGALLPDGEDQDDEDE